MNNSRVSCQKGPTRHAYAWQIGRALLAGYSRIASGWCADYSLKLMTSVVVGIITEPISAVHYFPKLLYLYDTLYNVYVWCVISNIWQVSVLLNCDDIWQVWMGFEMSKIYFCKVRNVANNYERTLK